MAARLTAGATKYLRCAARASGKLLFRLGAWLITACRPEPGNPVIIRIVRFMEASRTGRRLALAPAFSEFISVRAPDSPDSGSAGLSSEERAVLTVAAAAVAAKKPGRAAQVLDAHLAEQGARAHPLMYERLADVHLAAAQPGPAESVLIQGLHGYPSNARLRRSMADVLARKQEWRQARAHWEQVPDELRASANVWTAIGIVRAYRQSGSPEEADAVARRAAAVHPPNEQLEREIELCRPYHVDWPRALTAVPGLEGDDSTAVGTVASMGFLVGNTEPLTGRIDSSAKETPTVTLRVNGVTVTSTLAARSPDTSAAWMFSINCADLLQYLGDGDIIQVISDDKPVMLPSLGTAAKVRCDLTSRVDVLAGELAQGCVFTKVGRLRPGHTDASKRALLDHFEDVSALIQNSTGRPVYPFYGNLLGAIRENDFIVHDVDGFDMMVLCAGSDPIDVIAEVTDICRLLLQQGYDLKIKSSSVMIRRRASDTMFIDMNFGWFTAKDELHVSYGWRFEPVREKGRFIARRACRLVDREVPVPGNAEEVLVQLYGPFWRVPDQGYPAASNLQRDAAYLIPEAGMRVFVEQYPHQVRLEPTG